MNRPSAFSYLVGNPISALGILGGTLFLIYQWWTYPDQTPWLLPVIGIMATNLSLNANQQIQDYKSWKTQWDAMGGTASPLLPKLLHRLRMAITIGICVSLASILYQPKNEQEQIYQGAAAILGFLLLTGFYNLMRWQWRKRAVKKAEQRLKRKPDPIVTVSLPVPKNVATAQTSQSLLPHYCAALLEKNQHTKSPIEEIQK